MEKARKPNIAEIICNMTNELNRLSVLYTQSYQIIRERELLICNLNKKNQSLTDRVGWLETRLKNLRDEGI
jgi:hypothetical protein